MTAGELMESKGGWGLSFVEASWPRTCPRRRKESNTAVLADHADNGTQFPKYPDEMDGSLLAIPPPPPVTARANPRHPPHAPLPPTQSPAIDDDVIRLEVAVHDAALVQVAHRLRYLPGGRLAAADEL